MRTDNKQPIFIHGVREDLAKKFLMNWFLSQPIGRQKIIMAIALLTPEQEAKQ